MTRAAACLTRAHVVSQALYALRDLLEAHGPACVCQTCTGCADALDALDALVQAVLEAQALQEGAP